MRTQVYHRREVGLSLVLLAERLQPWENEWPSSTDSIATPFGRLRRPVGSGRTGNKGPEWLSRRAYRTSGNVIPLLSASKRMCSGSNG